MNDDGMTLQDFLPGGEDMVAEAGEKLPEGTRPAGEEALVEALRTVYDPEIPVNLYDLGLIYELDIAADGDVKVTMTLTTPACPVAGLMPQQVAEAVAGVEGVGKVTVELVWDPPWTMDKMTEEARLMLDMF